MTDQSAITFSVGGVVHTGDAILLYQARVVRQGLKACKIGLRLNRTYTPTNCLRAASRFTTKKYGRGKPALETAIQDLSEWINAAEAAMPVEIIA